MLIWQTPVIHCLLHNCKHCLHLLIFTKMTMTSAYSMIQQGIMI